MKTLIRKAVPGDGERLLALSRLFDDLEDRPRALETAEASLAGNPTEEIFVAERDSSLVAFASFQLTHTFNTERPTAELTGIYVREACRRQGIASALLAAIVERCHERDALELFLRVNRENAGALCFYRASGLQEANHHEYRMKFYD